MVTVSFTCRPRVDAGWAPTGSPDVPQEFRSDCHRVTQTDLKGWLKSGHSGSLWLEYGRKLRHALVNVCVHEWLCTFQFLESIFLEPLS